MKVVSIEAARVTQLFVADEVRGERDIYLPQLFDSARQRYGFVKLPNLEDAKLNGAKFQHGRLQRDSGGESITIEAVEIYNDGIVVSCRDSSDAEVVLDDIIAWGMQTFGLREPKTMIPRLYASFIVVDFKSATSDLIKRFEELQKILTDAYSRSYSVQRTFGISKLAFAVDPTTLSPHASTEFVFDRRAGAAYGLNRFFCMAPLSTGAHIALLSRFEELL